MTESLDKRKYKTVLRIGPVQSLIRCASITSQMELFLYHRLDLKIYHDDYKFAIENDISPFYITVEIATDKIEDGIESMLTMQYLDFADKKLSKYLQYTDYAYHYCPYVPDISMGRQEIKILKSRKL